MGIPGLARRLEPYAARYAPQELGGYTAIIDGPGLAYDAHRVAAAAAACQLRMPSYADINAEAIRWLKSLEDINIKVSAIFFDGALPNSKKNERVSRLQSSIKRVTTFRASYVTAACPVPRELGAAAYAFLAPSLKEALCMSDYASVTRMVPGEADDWCASYANDNPRTIVFTSDTDLVLYEYPPETLIMFFRDISLLPNPHFKAYSPTNICRRLKLGSLVPLAYAIIQEPWKSLSENVQEAQNYDLESDQYIDFSTRYTIKVQAPSHTSDRPGIDAALQNLDVRVSEFVNQALDTPFVPAVYPPLLLEDPNQASAWNLGQDLRILSYSLLAPDRVATQEYVRKAQSVAAVREYKLFSPSDVQLTAVELADNIRAWMQQTASRKRSQALMWPLFAVSIAIAQLKPPPTLTHLIRVLNGDFDNTWDFVHLNARIQVVFYSLRLFKQCIEVWLAVNPRKPTEALYDAILQLHQDLKSFPTIAELFIVPGQDVDYLGDDEEMRASLQDIYMSVGIQAPEEHRSKKQRKKERRAREKIEKNSQNKVQKKGPKQLSNNVFAVLGQGSSN